MKESYEAAAADLGISVEVFSAPTEGDNGLSTFNWTV